MKTAAPRRGLRLKGRKAAQASPRASARPVEQTASLDPGDRLVMVSDGVTASGEGQAGLADEGVVEAALRSRAATAADTVREIHKAVLAAAGGELTDDATAVCLSVE